MAGLMTATDDWRLFMIYPPGQGRSGQRLMQLWRQYLEQYADSEGDVEGQTIVAGNHAFEILTAFAETLDRGNKYRELIAQRYSFYDEGFRKAENFADRLMVVTFSIYNSLNTLSHQFIRENEQASGLIGKVDEQVHLSTGTGGSVERSGAALRASFALLSLMVITLDEDQIMKEAIRQIEQRFLEGASIASTGMENTLNALYRMVEMIQLFVLLTDPELKNQVNQIATRFKEEDQTREIPLKLRNGFCRFFELSHLLVTHVDEMI
jgi:hypothetical protein